jgi:hypothetical protein
VPKPPVFTNSVSCRACRACVVRLLLTCGCCTVVNRALYWEESNGTPFVMAKAVLYDPLLVSPAATSLAELQLSRLGNGNAAASLRAVSRCTNLVLLDLAQCLGLQDDTLHAILEGADQAPLSLAHLEVANRSRVCHVCGACVRGVCVSCVYACVRACVHVCVCVVCVYVCACVGVWVGVCVVASPQVAEAHCGA